MARTRGIQGLAHMDDGEILDKEGKPVNPNPVGRSTWSGVSQQANPEHVEAPVVEEGTEQPAVAVEPVYRCDASSVQRDADGWEVVRLLDVIFGGLSREVGPEEFGRLSADVKRHFRRIA